MTTIENLHKKTVELDTTPLVINGNRLIEALEIESIHISPPK